MHGSDLWACLHFIHISQRVCMCAYYYSLWKRGGVSLWSGRINCALTCKHHGFVIIARARILFPGDRYSQRENMPKEQIETNTDGSMWSIRWLQKVYVIAEYIMFPSNFCHALMTPTVVRFNAPFIFRQMFFFRSILPFFVRRKFRSVKQSKRFFSLFSHIIARPPGTSIHQWLG